MARPKKIPSIAAPDELDAEAQLKRIHEAWRAWTKLTPTEKEDIPLDPRISLYDRMRNAEDESERQKAALALDQMLRPRLKPVETVAANPQAKEHVVNVNLKL